MSVLFSILFDIRFTQAGITAITSTPAAAKRVGAFTFKSLINHNHTSTNMTQNACYSYFESRHSALLKQNKPSRRHFKNQNRRQQQFEG